MEPDVGLINNALAVVGIEGPRWLVDPKWALMSVALVDVWKGVGLAALIYMAGIVSIPSEYFEAARAEVEGFLKRASAQLWIQHDLPAHRKLKKAPEYYD